MSAPEPTIIKRVLSATQAPFAAVPAPVRERMTGEARLGLALMAGGALGALAVVWLMTRAAVPPPWYLVAGGLAVPALAALFGANLVSQRYVKAMVGALVAIIAAVRGVKPPPNGNGAAPTP